MGDVVGLVRAPSPKQIRNAIGDALDIINFKSKEQIRTVSIKVNLCYYWHAATGYTTDPRVVAGIIDQIRERYGENIRIRIVEADATAMKTRYAFKMLGYEKLAAEKNIELFNLSNDDTQEEKVRVNGKEIVFHVPRSLQESDLFINAPKLKISRETKITCALKNIFGCIAYPRKIIYHPILSEAIVGINKVLHPDLTVVDGLVALGRFPIALELIMVSRDPFSTDWIASQIMGFNPFRIKFLKIALREKLGDLEDIQLRGENIVAFKKIFPREKFTSSKYMWNMQLRLVKLYTRIVDDVVPPMLENDI